MYKLAFIIPHFNHSHKIANLVDALSKFEYEILIIDDGSESIHKEVLKKLKAKILYRKSNGGKGAALKDGFKYLAQNGFTHALQIDADMQHELDNLDEIIKLSKAHKNALICSAPIYSDDVPNSRFYGRKITNFWAAINTLSLKIKDAMCGLRIYPIEKTCALLPYCKANRMDYDIDILYLFHKAAIEILWVDVKVKYENDGISHFKILRDNLLISKTHARHFFDLPRYVIKRLLNG